MALNLSIKNVPEALADKLRARAEANHRSLQGELMALIESSVRNEDADQATIRQSAPQLSTPLSAKRIPSPRAEAGPKLTLHEVGERVRRRFPAPLALPPGMSAAELVRQMRDGRNGTQAGNAGHHDQGV